MKALLDLVGATGAANLSGLFGLLGASAGAAGGARGGAGRGRSRAHRGTANQVNQHGGYTGLPPGAFRDLVSAWPTRRGCRASACCWGGSPGTERLAGPAGGRGARASRRHGRGVRERAATPRSTSTALCPARRPRALSDAVVAERTAALCALAEAAWREAAARPPVYVIGTEVPVPGGAQETLTISPSPSPRQRSRRSRLTERRSEAGPRCGVGTHPRAGRSAGGGVRPRPRHRLRARHGHVRSSECLERNRDLVFEAHSTDYQSRQSLAGLVRDHFAILKVGPGAHLRAARSTVGAGTIAREWRGEGEARACGRRCSRRCARIPSHWRRYYHGEGRALALQLEYSLSDRIRYYWPVPAVTRHSRGSRSAFAAAAPPQSLLHEYLPAASAAVRRGALKPRLPQSRHPPRPASAGRLRRRLRSGRRPGAAVSRRAQTRRKI